MPYHAGPAGGGSGGDVGGEGEGGGTESLGVSLPGLPLDLARAGEAADAVALAKRRAAVATAVAISAFRSGDTLFSGASDARRYRLIASETNSFAGQSGGDGAGADRGGGPKDSAGVAC